MTNEEIKQKAQALYDNIGPDFGAQIEAALCETAAQAYEEAARRIDAMREDKGKVWHHIPYSLNRPSSDVLEDAAAFVRALKDSLSPAASDQ